jgi:hypothetical protein
VAFGRRAFFRFYGSEGARRFGPVLHGRLA